MENRVALVTGGARGIGFAISQTLNQKGFSVVIDDIYPANRIEENLKNFINSSYVQADISKTEDRSRIIDHIQKKYKRLDLLVNNAGVAPSNRLDILDATEKSFDRVISINLKGPYFLTQLVSKWMIEQKQDNPKRPFQIVNIASISSYTSSPSRGEYCISKAGMSMMTKLYADRLAEYGIQVFEIRPGIIFTDMTSKVKEKYDKLINDGLLPIKRWGFPKDVAQAVSTIALGHFSYSTGQVINVDGGFHLQRL